MRLKGWRLGMLAVLVALTLAISLAWWAGRLGDASQGDRAVGQARPAAGRSAFDAVLASFVGGSGATPGASVGDKKNPPFDQLTAKQMLLSNDPGRIDYAALTISVSCLSIRTTEDVWMQDAESSVADSRSKGDWSAGSASLAPRLAAYRRSRELCSARYPDGLVDDQFMIAVRLSQGFERWHSMRIKLDSADLGVPEGKAVLYEVMAANMFSAVKSLVASRLDLAQFEGSFPAGANLDLLWHASELLTCRMGDDCGAESPKALQLCWQAGICGGDLESAYQAHMRSVGLDADRFSRLVTELHNRLQQGDTSWLHRLPNKPAGTTPK